MLLVPPQSRPEPFRPEPFRPAGGIGRLADEAMHAIDHAAAPDELYAFVGSLCTEIGFEYFSYYAADPLQLGDRLSVDPMHASSYPAPWRVRYQSLGYQQDDPVLTSGRSSRRPFVWGGREYVGRLRGKPRQMFDDARSFGICGGLTIPIHGPHGDSGLFTVSSRETGAAFADVVREAVPLLHLVAHRVHAVMIERLLRPVGQDEIRLTEQERVCLLWTLRGKTAWEIASILGRSRPTVNFHLQKALRKLGTSSKSHAAVKALRAGLI